MSFDITKTDFWIDPLEIWTKWFTPLPINLAGQEPQLPERFDDLELSSPIAFINGLIQRMAVQCENYANPYHNTNHALRVMTNVLSGLHEIERQSGTTLPQGLQDVIALACVCHDHGHPGKTFLIDVPAPRFRRQYSIFDPETIAVEQVSAYNCVSELAQHRATRAQQLLATYLIWSTADGGTTKQGKKLGVDKVQPSRALGLLMRAADVTLMCDDVTIVDADIAVRYVEGDFSGSFDTYLAARRDFLSYIADCYQTLDICVGFELTSLLRWRSRLAENQLMLDAVVAGDPYATLIFRTQIEKHRMLNLFR